MQYHLPHVGVDVTKDLCYQACWISKEPKLWPTFFTIKPREELISKFILVSNSTRFRQFLCPSSAVFHCTFGTGTCYMGLTTGSGCSILILHVRCRQTCINMCQCQIYSGKLLMMGRETARNV